MPLELQQREVEGITILDLRGRLVAGGEFSVLRDAMDAIARQADSDKNIILNLKQVSYIDSSGLGALIAGHGQMTEAGGDLRLLKLSKRSAQLLILTKLTTVFQIFDDEQAAINSFFVGREVKPFDILEFVKSQEHEEDDAQPEPV